MPTKALLDPVTRALDRYEPHPIGPTSLAPTKDYIVDIPADADAHFAFDAPRHGLMLVRGGKIVRVDGGRKRCTSHVTVQRAAREIVLSDLLIDMAGRPTHDAINVTMASPGRVFLYDSEILNVSGTQAGVHGDCFQASSDIEALFIQRVKMSSAYQCLMIKNMPTRMCKLLVMDDVEAIGLSAKAKQLWLGDLGFSRPGEECHLTDVRVRPFGDRPLRDCVHPGPRAALPDGTPIGVIQSADGKECWWPKASGIEGVVRRI